MAEAREARWKKPEMVHWYDVGQLADTGTYVFLSTLLGSMIDTRRFPPLEGDDEHCIVDYSDASEVWFDYAADIGDGWDATYTMAYLFSSPEIELQPGTKLPRARFLVLGGDEVYPRASKNEYAQRLVWPFNQASRNLGHYSPDQDAAKPEHLRDIYCIPGNHDWYDGLAAFTRRFCNRRNIGSFQTRQCRSYFVLRLPHRWQIWAADVQLGHDLDVHQLNFFRKHAESLEAGTRVILCLAEPEWVYGERSREDLHFNIERLERMIEAKGGKVPLQLAGDIHNYQRYEGPRNPGGGHESYRQTKIVSGGGGAFLHPNHTYPERRQLPRGFTCENRYPDARTTWRLSFGNLLFAFKNWRLSCLLGLVYLILFWSVPVQHIGRTFPLENPGSALLMILLFMGLWYFSDFRVRTYNFFWGLAHAAAHVGAAFLTWLWVPGLFPDTWAYVPRLAVFLVGSAFGGTVFGLYLLLSLNVFKIHENEAFSSLRIPNYKHLLRFHLTENELKLHVIAVDKTAGEDATHPVPTRLIEVRSIS